MLFVRATKGYTVDLLNILPRPRVKCVNATPRKLVPNTVCYSQVLSIHRRMCIKDKETKSSLYEHRHNGDYYTIWYAKCTLLCNYIMYIYIYKCSHNTCLLYVYIERGRIACTVKVRSYFQFVIARFSSRRPTLSIGRPISGYASLHHSTRRQNLL